jgi:predicted Ser/Thr protein kinase
VSRPDDVTAAPDGVTKLPSGPKSDSGWLTGSDAISHGRFAPGTILADRYRVIGLLGTGGMGEVYRADDLKLGQPVALKFLPQDLARDATRLARFHSEVRLARQISHPNVCRVYDVGEVGGATFLSMEYVDGEDLSSLLRRIGRLPEDKALEIARQLCAGIAAAHSRGVLHRDLKPANVMIDGRGNVRVMDFGLAVATGSADIDHAGTPAYMAPEQLAGRDVSAQSDIYALGLVLFEMFTGRRALAADSLADLQRLHESDSVTTRPSAVVPGLDPAIERAILRCLERDPSRRPSSALAVSAALPGGDPLAAALAAGETPSPAMVAAAGREDAIPARLAIASLAVIALALLALPVIADRVLLVRAIPAIKPVDVLVDRAQTIRRSLGYAEAPRDEFYDIEEDEDYLRYVASSDASPDRWDKLRLGRPSPVVFWYRSSPRPLADSAPGTEPSREDPPLTVSGMTTIVTDPQGRLVEFAAVPPQRETETSSIATPDWSVLFNAAELPMAAFRSVPPTWTPRTFADTRAAWEGALPERPDVSVKIEAAGYRGRPVFFQIVGPWTRAAQQESELQRTSDMVVSIVGSIVITALIIGAAIAARHHLRRGRADRRSADRLALAILALFTVSWMLGAHHMGDVEADVNDLFLFLALVLLVAAMDWLFYLALEPLVRKWDPRALVGWTRLMNGAIRDPHVGRDVLVGVVAGSLFALSLTPRGLMATLAGGAPSAPIVTSFAPFLGIHKFISNITLGLPGAIANGMLLVLAFAFLRMLLGRTWLAAAVVIGLLVGANALEVSSSPGRWMELLITVPGVTMMLVVAIRFGLLTTIVMIFVWLVLVATPLTADPSMRYFAASAWTLAGVFALAVFAAHAARAGRPLFQGS